MAAIKHRLGVESSLASIEDLDLDFISYACHYDEETILTKQGDLLKIIKVEDYSSSSNSGDLRTAVRKSISGNINNPYMAVWLHTVRRPNRVNLRWYNTKDFSDQLHSTWFNRAVNDKLQYTNELYIVVLLSHADECVSNALSLSYMKGKYKLSLQKKHQELKNVTELMKDDLECFGARILGIRFDESSAYSEMVEFLYYLITSTNQEYKMSEQDLSQYLRDLKIAFGFNTFQTVFNNQQRFGAIFNLKEYREITSDNIDECLQSDFELTITEILIFSNNHKAIKEFKKQVNMLQISGDKELFHKSGLREITEFEEVAGIDFCQQKIIFTVLANDRQKLAENVNHLSFIMSTIGLIISRTDLHIENYFWAQLPGNFSFIPQSKYSLIKYACSFAMLHDFTSGMLKGGRWKEAITVFFSKSGTPYFFNFHGKKNSGHTTILGAPNSGRTSLINFLLSEARKLNPRIVILDNTGKSIIFTKAVNGKYYAISAKGGLHFNPLNIEDNATSRSMLCELIKRMIDGSSSQLEETGEKIKKVVDCIFTIPKELRSISQISSALSLLGGNIEKWFGDGEFAYLFGDGDDSDIDWQAKIISINIANLTNQKECMSVILYYFLYSFEIRCNGEPAILVLDEAWEISSIFSTEREFDDWMKKMTKLNVVVILSTENLSLAFASKFTQYLDKHIDTKILMPNINANKLYVKAFALSKDELSTILQTPEQEGLFLIKQYKELVALSLDLKNIQEMHVLSANARTIKYMNEAIEKQGEEVNQWLPVFYEKCKS